MTSELVEFLLALVRAPTNFILNLIGSWWERWRGYDGDRMKTLVRLAIVIILLLLCTTTADTMPATLHQCTVTIKRATPDKLLLELWSTSQATSYSVDINYSHAPCLPWNGQEENWALRKELPSGLYALPWIEFYDENPGLGMEACINWTCQPEVIVIYGSQDYETVRGYLFLPLIGR